MFEEEREYFFSEAEVVVQVKAFAIGAPIDEFVGLLVIDQRPKLGHESRHVGTRRGNVGFRGRGRHCRLFVFVNIYNCFAFF